MLKIKENVNLAKYTTFKIGGEARYMVDVQSESDLREALAFVVEKNLKFTILAGGSNMLFSDDGFDGLVIRIAGGNVQFYNNSIIAEAGASLTETIRASAEEGLSGWESMCGIPGSIGGAVRGNAGAFGTEVKDVLSKVRAMNLQTGEVRDFNNKECKFGYRTSYFKMHPEWVVLTAVFKFNTDIDTEDCSTNKASKLSTPSRPLPRDLETSFAPQSPVSSLLQKCDEIVAEREKRHLQDVAAAGSFFKNPVCTEHPKVIKQFEGEKGVESRGGKIPAGWLIEQCKLKGIRVGDALCSEQHPNYIVNMGNATAKDVLELRDIIKNSVKEKFGIELEEEVTIIK